MFEARKKDGMLDKMSQASVSLALRLIAPVHFALICDTADRRGAIGLYNCQVCVAEDASRPEPHYHTL